MKVRDVGCGKEGNEEEREGTCARGVSDLSVAKLKLIQAKSHLKH